MKHPSTFKALFVAMISMGIALGSCDKADDTTDPNAESTGTKPTIEISNIVAGSTQVSFTLTPTNAIEYEYSVAPVGETTDFTSERSSKEKEFTVSKLEQGVEYEIVAYAYDIDNQKSDAATASFLTEATETYPRMSLAYKFTATWCSNCPYMTEALDEIVAADPTSLAIVAIHNETSAAYDYNTTGGDALIKEWSMTAYPTTRIDYRQDCSSSVSSLSGAMEISKDYPSTANIAITSSVEDGKAKIVVDTKYGATARYKIAVVITENNIEEPNTEGSYDGFYHHVTRTFLTEALGDTLNKLSLGDTLTHEYECEIPENWNVDELEVTAIVLKEEVANNYYANNVAVCSINGSVDFK